MIRNLLRPLYLYYKSSIGIARLKKSLSDKNKDIKIVVGSSEITQTGWIQTEEYFLNLLKENDWVKYFKEDSISNIVAEHVWEHLNIENGYIAACTCYKFLKKGGKLRVAVPDGFHSGKEYIDYVKPGGSGIGADDHKILYNRESITELFSRAGFRIELLEYFDKEGNFHSINWDKNEGFIHRSIKYDKRNKNLKPNYTSLIIDAIK